MLNKAYSFSGKQVQYYFGGSVSSLNKYADPSHTILIVDDQVDHFHGAALKGWRKIVIPGKEASKDVRVFEQIVNQLIDLEADRKTMLVGIGGGVITDLTGFVASVYMRGIKYGFVPTTLLSQVDAAIGGKNGINFGLYKNMIGIIRQPEFLLFDAEIMQTLPETEWHNGFAEIIKYACICDAELFAYLEENKKRALSHDMDSISFLVERSANIKSMIVQEDEFENGQRRLLNFGHTVGHAVEKLEGIAHGQAVAKGMVVAADLSCILTGLSVEEKQRIVDLICQYHLPINIQADTASIAHHFRMDKKREEERIHFILLKKIGEALVKPIALDDLTHRLKSLTGEKV